MNKLLRILSALLCFGLGSITLAAPTYAQVRGETIIVTGGLSRIPLGDQTAADTQSVAIPEIPRPLSPIGDAELKRLKKLHGARFKSVIATPSAAASNVKLLTTCPTNTSDGPSPSDIHGAATATTLFVATNVTVALYKTADCSLIGKLSIVDFFKQHFTDISPTAFFFDPQVLFDREIGRCIFTVETKDNNKDQYQYWAVSATSDCSSFHDYRVAVELGTTTFCKKAGDFWDRPAVGSIDRPEGGNAGRWFIIANAGSNASMLLIDKAPTLTGQPTTTTCYKTLVSETVPPNVLHTDTVAYFISPRGPTFGSDVALYKLTTSTSGPSSDVLRKMPAITLAKPWTPPPPAIQPNGQKLDTSDGRFTAASIQIGSLLYNIHPINNAGFSQWRLYQFDPTHSNLLADISVRSTSDPAEALFNPSLAVDAYNGNFLMYVNASRTINTSKVNGNAAMVIFRGSADLTDTTSWSVVRIAVSPSQYVYSGKKVKCNDTNSTVGDGTCRWGDYSAIQVELGHTAVSRAWGFNQLVTGNAQANWGTDAARVGN